MDAVCLSVSEDSNWYFLGVLICSLHWLLFLPFFWSFYFFIYSPDAYVPGLIEDVRDSCKGKWAKCPCHFEYHSVAREDNTGMNWILTMNEDYAGWSYCFWSGKTSLSQTITCLFPALWWLQVCAKLSLCTRVSTHCGFAQPGLPHSMVAIIQENKVPKDWAV